MESLSDLELWEEVGDLSAFRLQIKMTMDALVLSLQHQAPLGVINMNAMDPTTIDMLHSGKMHRISKQQLYCIYSIIRSNPLKYLFANGYIVKFVIFNLIPFVILLACYLLIIKPLNLGNGVDFVFSIILTWLWFNKNTCYAFIKFSMIIHTFLPFTNTTYFFYSSLTTYRYTRIMLLIVLAIISAIVINLSFFL